MFPVSFHVLFSLGRWSADTSVAPSSFAVLVSSPVSFHTSSFALLIPLHPVYPVDDAPTLSFSLRCPFYLLFPRLLRTLTCSLAIPTTHSTRIHHIIFAVLLWQLIAVLAFTHFLFGSILLPSLSSCSSPSSSHAYRFTYCRIRIHCLIFMLLCASFPHVLPRIFQCYEVH